MKTFQKFPSWIQTVLLVIGLSLIVSLVLIKKIVDRQNDQFLENSEQVSGILENVVDKYGQLTREVDALAAAMVSLQQEVKELKKENGK